MNIGILTFHFALNYGAMLQAYALLSTIRNDGHSCQIIDYMPAHMSGTCNINPISTNLQWKNKLKSLLKLPLRYLSYRKFTEFSREFLMVETSSPKKRETFTIPNTVSTVVVGSDQVWNGDITHNDPAYFFAPFHKTVTCHSYAASIGSDLPTEEVATYCREYLPLFSSISVRESNLQELLSTEMDLAVSHVLDPVFLHKKRHWSSVARKPPKVPEKYILYYSLEENQELAQNCCSISRATGLPIISIHPFARCFIKGSKQLYSTGPQEFLWLIENAEYVCTNSFHAVAFSGIFQKKLIYQSHSSLGARVASLFQLFSLVYDDLSVEANGNKLQIVDFAKSDNTRIEEMITASKYFIQGIYR